MKLEFAYCGNHGGLFQRRILATVDVYSNPDASPWYTCDEQYWRVFWGERPKSDWCQVKTQTGKHLKPVAGAIQVLW